MKDIKGFEGQYAIAKDGRVWSYTRDIIKKNRWGKITNYHWKGRWLKSNTNKMGNWYFSISLSQKNRKGFKIHRLIAQAFIPNPQNLPEVNHKNGNKTDNRIENLEWCTRKENLEYAKRTFPISKRNIKRGEKNWCHKLTEKDIKKIRKEYAIKKELPKKCHKTSFRKIAKRYGVSATTIRGIILGWYWKNII